MRASFGCCAVLALLAGCATTAERSFSSALNSAQSDSAAWSRAAPNLLDRLHDERTSLRFEPLHDTNANGLLTAYATPRIRASHTQTSKHRFALYGKPQAGTCATRRAIVDQDLLDGLELAWLDDELDAYLVSVNGSVRLDWIDGSKSTTLAVAATNGHAYASLGRLAIDAGLASENEMSLARLRTLHETHEAELAALMLENPRFIMFRALDEDETLRGKRGETIVGFVSLAADDAHDTGAVILIEPLDGGQPFLGLVHDGGAAIQGPARFDRYFGASEEALRHAGEMQSPIRAWRVVFTAEKTSPKKR